MVRAITCDISKEHTDRYKEDCCTAYLESDLYEQAIQLADWRSWLTLYFRLRRRNLGLVFWRKAD